MSEPRHFPNGFYGDVTPEGRFCITIRGSHIETDLGRVDFAAGPGTEPLQIKISRYGERFTGTSQVGPDSFEYSHNTKKWASRGAYFGNDAAIYDKNDELVVVREAGTYTGSIGWWFLADDGTLIATWEVYNPETTLSKKYGVEKLWQWTKHGDIIIGQGEDGVHALVGKERRRVLIDKCDADFVRFKRNGDSIGLAWVRHDKNDVAIQFLTVQELYAYPTYPPEEPDMKLVAPVVTVQNWTLDELLNGREFVFEDTNNPELKYKTRVWIENNSMYAQTTNAMGSAQTGKTRPVKQCPQVPVEPPIDPPITTKGNRIKTIHGKYWAIDYNGVLYSDSIGQNFEVENLPDPLNVAFKAPNGMYLCAENKGELNQLIANRPTVGEWETFKSYAGVDDTEFSLKAVNEKFVCAREDDSITIDINIPSTWESFTLDEPVAPTINTKPIRIDGKFFRIGDDRFSIIQCSDFSLFKRYLEGEDIRGILEERLYCGFNFLRIWLLNYSVVAFRNGIEQDGIHPNQYSDFYSRLSQFTDYLNSYGLYVEYTVFTSTKTLMPSQSDQQNHLNRTADAVRGKINVILELVNENDQYDNATADLSRPSGVIISRGSNGADSVPPRHDSPWDYELYHTNDLNEWWRKTGHNAMEWADESGRPCASNENTRPDKDSSHSHSYDAAAGGALLCAGSCFHSNGGKFSRHLDPTEFDCAILWVAGAKSVPLEFQIGQYRHRQDLEKTRSYSSLFKNTIRWTRIYS
jgi:hypothetical protein